MRFSAAFCMSHVQVYVGALLVFHLLMDIAVNVSFSPIALSTSRKEVHKLDSRAFKNSKTSSSNSTLRTSEALSLVKVKARFFMASSQTVPKKEHE